LSCSETLEEATGLFCQQLRVSIRDGKAKPDVLHSILSVLNHLDPFEVDEEYGFLWVTDILNSGYTDNDRHQMATRVIQLLGKKFHPDYPVSLFPNCIPPLLDFPPPHENLKPPGGLIALRILTFGREDSDFGARILPVFMSILQLAHPLRSCSLALKIFHQFAAGWFSSQMESVLYKDLDRLLQAVGDPFQFQDDRHTTTDYEPMKTVVVLIEFMHQ